MGKSKRPRKNISRWCKHPNSVSFTKINKTPYQGHWSMERPYGPGGVVGGWTAETLGNQGLVHPVHPKINISRGYLGHFCLLPRFFLFKIRLTIFAKIPWTGWTKAL